MKGHTKIILTNVETGEQEIHEDDNIITDAVNHLINIMIGTGFNLNSYVLPIATKALGGLMLFDDTLTEDPANIHFPAEAHLVGYAARDLNSSDAMRGSLNSGETYREETEAGYSHTSVWDFGTNQANGTIKSLARTSAFAGACPFYYHSGQDRNYEMNYGAPASDQDWRPVRYDGKYLYLLKGNSSTHIMRLARVKFPLNSFGTCDYSGMGKTLEVIASWDTLVTSYRYDSGRQTQYVYCDDPSLYRDGRDGYIYTVAFYKPTRSNAESYPYNITYFRVNYGDGTYTKSATVQTNGGGNCYAPSNTYSMSYSGRFTNGYLYRTSSDRKRLFHIPIDAPSEAADIRVIDASSQDYIAGTHFITVNDICILEVYHYIASGYNYRMGCVYPDGHVIVMEQSVGGTNYRADDIHFNYPMQGDNLVQMALYGDKRMNVSWRCDYLGTINNLSEPIVKTAAQTMKIIYTLSDVE